MSDHTRLYQDEGMDVKMEVTDTLGVFLHCKVNGWSREIKSRLTEVYSEVLAGLRLRGVEEVHAAVCPTDFKHQRFVSMLGFTGTGRYVLDNEGGAREVYVDYTGEF